MVDLTAEALVDEDIAHCDPVCLSYQIRTTYTVEVDIKHPIYD